MIDNQFTVLNLIGHGGSSQVYQVEDVQNGGVYGLKLLKEDGSMSFERATRLAQREFETMQSLHQHPNILTSYYYKIDGKLSHSGQEEDDIVYHLLEFAENGSLSNIVKYTGALPEEVAKFMFMQLIDGLNQVHHSGFAHLDLKLENILLDEYFNLKLADFGSSCQLQKSAQYGDRKGTVFYMAPEVDRLEQGETFDAFKADLYSLGVCLHVMLFGDKNFGG